MNDRSQPRFELEPALARYREAPESKLFAPLAAAYRDSGRPEEAVRILQAGLERHPRYVSALVLLAQCHLDLQQEADAESVFGRVLEQDAENLIALRHRAELARRRGALERAVELLRRALEIDPFDRDVQADLGLATTALERRVRETTVVPPPVASLEPPPPVTPAPPFPRPIETPLRPTAPPPPAAAPAPHPPETLRAWPPVKDEPAWRSIPEPQSPWLEPPATATPLPAEPLAPERGLPNLPWEPAGASATPSAAPEPPRIDLRQVGASAPETVWPRVPEATPPAAPETPTADRSSWTFTRDDDRIVVAPDTPVRGPIRSVEDRLWSERRQAFRAADPPPETPPPSATAEPEPPAPVGEFATLTLARIYESQGYYQKALGIYDELLRRHAGDAEVASRRAALQRRLAGIDEGPAEPASAASDAQPPVAWRLLDPAALESPAQAAERLRQTTQAARDAERARRHVVVGPPPQAPTPAPVEPPVREDVSRGHPDYERFLAYVRSLRREA